VIDAVLIALGTSLATGFGSWVFFIRKHKAEAVGTEKTNDRSEIENYKLISQEWREAAQQWKDLCDEYQTKLIETLRKLDTRFVESDKELAANKEEIKKLRAALAVANKRIVELEDYQKHVK
jgi:uncharacterized membrane protein